MDTEQNKGPAERQSIVEFDGAWFAQESLQFPGTELDFERVLLQTAETLAPLYPSLRVAEACWDDRVMTVTVEEEDTGVSLVEEYGVILSRLTGTGFELLSSDSRKVVSLPTPDLPVFVEGHYPDPVVDTALVRSAIRSLGGVESHVVLQELHEKSIRTILGDYAIRPPNVSCQEGVWEVRLEHSPSILRSPWVGELFGRLAGETGEFCEPVRVVLSASPEDLFRRTALGLNHDFPWRLEVNVDARTADIVIPAGKSEEVRHVRPLLCQRLLALTGYRVDLREDSPDGNSAISERFISPPVTLDGTKLKRRDMELKLVGESLPRALMASEPRTELYGNSILVDYYGAALPADYLDDVLRELPGLSFPLYLRAMPADSTISRDQVLEALREVVNTYPLRDPELKLKSDSVEVLYHNDQPTEQTPWYSRCRGVINGIANSAGLDACFIRKSRPRDVYSAFADEARTNVLWRLDFDQSDQNKLLVLVEDLKAFDTDRLTVALLYRTGWTAEFKELPRSVNQNALEIFPIVDDCQLDYEHAAATEKLVRDNIYEGLGQTAVHREGNRILVIYAAKNLPEPYMRKLSNRLSRLEMVVSLEEGVGPHHRPTLKQFEEVARESAPDGYYLHSVDTTESGFRVNIYGPEWKELTDYHKQLEAYAGSEVEVLLPGISDEFAELLGELPEDYAQLVAQTGDSFGLMFPGEKFRVGYQRLFGPKGYKIDWQKLYASGRRDLTKQLTVAVDSSGTRIAEDGLSVCKLENGDHRVSIHVVDPTWLVLFGGQVDNHARKRILSDQGKRHHIAMFPDYGMIRRAAFATGRDRAAITLQVDIQQDGSIANYEFMRSIVRLDRKWSFEQANQDLAEGRRAPFSVRLRQLQSSLEAHSLYNRNADAISVDPSPSHLLVSTATHLFDELSAKYLSEHGIPYPEWFSATPSGEKAQVLAECSQTYGAGLSRSEKEDPQALRAALVEISKCVSPQHLKRILATVSEPAGYGMATGEADFVLGKQLARATRPLKSYASLITIRNLERSLRGVAPIPAEEMSEIVEEMNWGRRNMEVRERASMGVSLLNYAFKNPRHEVEVVRIDTGKHTVMTDLMGMDARLLVPPNLIRSGRFAVDESEGNSNLQCGDKIKVKIVGYDLVGGVVVVKPI